MSPRDARIERLITNTALRMQAAASPAARRYEWNKLQRLHRLRSPAQVERLERAKGLRGTNGG